MKLVNLAERGEEGAAVTHLSHNASNAPQVHGAGVDAGAHENLGGTVPQSDNLNKEEEEKRVRRVCLKQITKTTLVERGRG